MLPFFLLTFGLLFGLGVMFASVDRQDVIANWDKRRCDVPVLIGGALYKPTTDERSSLEFASANFKFCMEKVVRDVFTVVLNPILALFKQQIDFAIIIKEIQNGIQSMLANFFRTFSKLLDGVFQRFMSVGFQFRRIFIEALQAMERAFGIAISTVFLGIATIVGIDNGVQFVIKVVIIILGILAGLMILLFFILLPVLPIIMTTIAVLVAAGVGAAGGFSGAFCFAPGTRIATHRGSLRIDKVAIGDTLSDGGVIEGILRVNGSKTQLYQLEDTIVSGDHLVYYEPLKTWILVKDHPSAHVVQKKEPLLYCLNTSTRTIPIGSYKFRDWEELTPDLQKDWNELVAHMLNGKAQQNAEDYPLLSGAWFVETPDGRINIRDVHLGTKILDETHSYTKILGIYEGIEQVASTDPFWATDSLWWKEENEWRQKPVCSKFPYKKYGFHLITDSGTFKIFNPSGEFCVRDFTEVGNQQIAETYEWMKRRL
jgi:hypothetical protein